MRADETKRSVVDGHGNKGATLVANHISNASRHRRASHIAHLGRDAVPNPDTHANVHQGHDSDALKIRAQSALNELKKMLLWGALITLFEFIFGLLGRHYIDIKLPGLQPAL